MVKIPIISEKTSKSGIATLSIKTLSIIFFLSSSSFFSFSFLSPSLLNKLSFNSSPFFAMTIPLFITETLLLLIFLFLFTFNSRADWTLLPKRRKRLKFPSWLSFFTFLKSCSSSSSINGDNASNTVLTTSAVTSSLTTK